MTELPAAPENRAAAGTAAAAPVGALRRGQLEWIAIAVLVLACVASLALAWRAEQRGAALEQELVRRQQDNAQQVAEARMMARQAQDSMADAVAKVALLDARVAEVAVQRSQLEELIQSLARSRDENVLIEVDAGIRSALQQAAITGSIEPLVATLKQSDERLARYSQPRLDGVRRAIARDLDRARATGLADIASLNIKLDEAIRLVDELPLLAAAEPLREPGRTSADGSSARGGAAAAPAAAAASAGASAAAWSLRWGQFGAGLGERIWSEARSLVRVTRIDHPEAMLMAPEQSFYFRENLKLRLLDARLALWSRQFDAAQSDLRAAQAALERYFDRSNKRTALAGDLIRQVAAQARQVAVPRPDDTLAALAAATGGR